MSELKITNRLRAILRRYGVTPPSKGRPVTHLSEGTTAMIPPVVFAAYEAHVKAQYLCWKPQMAQHPEYAGHFLCLASNGGFSLLQAGDEQQAADDCRYLASLIIRAGHYFDLLD